MKASGRPVGDALAALLTGTGRCWTRTFPFDETLEAMAYVEQGKAKGKVVITW